ncbi:hypothetical protein AB838_08520 [Rhodobacteraceae bacterium (ex Bugula neritina AB1)]|nr:hypothetical protein AB838_08520 [Rhodobacteraceae bacterium (ex Bugula neritina AB1)]
MSKTDELKKAYAMDYTDTASVQDHYDAWAEAYDQDTQGFGYVGPANAARVLSEHLELSAAAVLDIGCGTGLVGVALAQLGAGNVDGTDLSEKMITRCRETGAYRDLKSEDLLQGLAAQDGSYDAVISVGTFGPLGPDALQPALAPVKIGGLACISINEIFWDQHGFDAAFTALCDTGAWRLVTRETVLQAKEGGLQARVTLLRRSR